MQKAKRILVGWSIRDPPLTRWVCRASDPLVGLTIDSPLTRVCAKKTQWAPVPSLHCKPTGPLIPSPTPINNNGPTQD